MFSFLTHIIEGQPGGSENGEIVMQSTDSSVFIRENYLTTSSTLMMKASRTKLLDPRGNKLSPVDS